MKTRWKSRRCRHCRRKIETWLARAGFVRVPSLPDRSRSLVGGRLRVCRACRLHRLTLRARQPAGGGLASAQGGAGAPAAGGSAELGGRAGAERVGAAWRLLQGPGAPPAPASWGRGNNRVNPVPPSPASSLAGPLARSGPPRTSRRRWTWMASLRHAGRSAHPAPPASGTC